MYGENLLTKPGNSGSSQRRRYQKEEEVIVRRRNAEWDRRQLWSGVNNYFKSWDVHVNKFSTWASPEFYNFSYDNHLKDVESQKWKENLEKRKKCLSELLSREEFEYNQELKNIKRGSKIREKPSAKEGNVCFMNLELKRRDDEAARREGELKLYHHYSFPNLNTYQKQYNYFSKRAYNEEHRNSLKSVDVDYFRKDHSSTPDQLTLKIEKDVVLTKNLKLNSEIDRQINELEKLKTKVNNLKSEEEKLKEQIVETKSKFNDILSEDENDCESTILGFVSSSDCLNRWRNKSKIIQNNLKRQIQFLDDVVKIAESIKEYTFKFEVEKVKRSFSKRLQTESGREMLSNLFECSYREPVVWWREECKMWKEHNEESKKQLNEVFSKLESMEVQWYDGCLAKQQRVIQSQEKILNDIEKSKADIDTNNTLLNQLCLA